MKFSIESARNGCVLTTEDDEEEVTLVYQEPEEGEVEMFAEFLQTILDTFGPTTSRYSKKRVYIRIEPGDKYEGEKDVN